MSLSNASSSFASQLSRFARSNSPRLALPSRPLAFACSSLAFWSRFGPVASARLFLASFSALFSLPAFASLGALEADAGKRMPASAEFRIESTFFRFFPSPKACDHSNQRLWLRAVTEEGWWPEGRWGVRKRRAKGEVREMGRREGARKRESDAHDCRTPSPSLEFR
eukprot:2474482-Rhodomonas_salina.1